MLPEIHVAMTAYIVFAARQNRRLLLCHSDYGLVPPSGSEHSLSYSRVAEGVGGESLLGRPQEQGHFAVKGNAPDAFEKTES